MALYDKKIDYQGQDLHMLRNNEQFPLHLFFDEIADLSYEFLFDRLYIDENVDYEKIKVLVTQQNQKVVAVNIQAEPYVSGNGYRTDNFFVTISNNNTDERTTILIHLHNAIDHAWTSPSTLTIRKGMELKFGVLVSFTDGDYGDLSFYPEMMRNLIYDTYLNIPPFPDPPYLPVYDPRRLSWKADPPSDNYPIYDALTIILPPWMKNTGSEPLEVMGNVRMIKDFGDLHFHRGNIEDIDNQTNILFLSDGFDGSSDADVSMFYKTIDEFSTQQLEKRTYAPWNLLSSKVNIWSYYTQDQHKYSSSEGEHIVIKTDDTTPVIAELYHFINFFNNNIFQVILGNNGGVPLSLDTYIQNAKKNYSIALTDFLELDSSNLGSDFPLIQVPPLINSSRFLTLSQLCSLVGLPSQSDSVNYITKFDEWNALGWVNNVSRVLSDLTSGNNLLYLHPYVFKIWSKLKGRIFLEKTDTSYGVTNTFLKREFAENFQPVRTINPGISKFPPAVYNSDALKKFGAYISKIPNIDSESNKTFGEIFYTDSGDHELGKGLNKELNYELKPCDNIVILSRVRTNGTYGVNTMIGFTDIDNSDPNHPIERKYSVHLTAVSLEGRITTAFECNRNTLSGPAKYEMNNLSVKRVQKQVRNTIAHEFSHNYLRDELSVGEGNIIGKRDAVDIKKTLEISNLTTTLDIETSPGSNIDGDKIKWRWPRIKKIGLGLLDSPNNLQSIGTNLYKCTIKTTARNENDKENGFEERDNILLRKRFLFDNIDTDYIRGTIEVVTNQGGDNQTITFQTLSPIQQNDITEFNSNGYIIIKPAWRKDNTTVWEELVHHGIRGAITAANAPLVKKDNKNSEEPQKIDQSFEDNHKPALKKAGSIKLANIVGLYAGGFLSYREGIYHPTGFCLMRGSKNNTPNKFCPVCSYIMIDYIDPLQHPFMDKRYPKYKY